MARCFRVTLITSCLQASFQFHMGLSWALCCSSYTLPAWLTSSTDMVFTLTCMPKIRRYRTLVALGLPTSSSPPCQLVWMKCLTGCDQIAYSWTLRRQKSSGARQHVGWTSYHLLLCHVVLPSTDVRDLRILILTTTSLCGLMCRMLCRDVVSTASDV